MKIKNLLVLLVSVLALAVVSQSVSAFGTIRHVEVNGVNADSGTVDFAGFAGERVPVFVQFDAGSFEGTVEDVKLVAWVSGNRKDAVESERFDVLPNRTYSRVVYLKLPTNLGNLHEPRTIEIVVESEEKGEADSKTIKLTVQRESYKIEILGINMLPEVKAGESLFIDVVLKNRGSHFADDTFVKVWIPELQVETSSYFGDLAPVDQSDPDKEDASERRVYLRIPSNVKTGLYTVKLLAETPDSFAEAEKRIYIVGSEKNSRVVSSVTSRTFAVNKEEQYSLTLINKGNTIQVYDLVISAPDGLDINVEDSVVVVPAGSAKTINLVVSATKAGTYDFNVDVRAEDGSIVSQNKFRARVEGESKTSPTTIGGVSTNATVLLTVVLAIIFVVLLVVLIVLLTRKPEKSEEYGESYY